MRTSLLVTALLLAGCGVSEADVSDVGNDVSAAEGELGTTTRSYVVFRHDSMRRCPSPMCGGKFVRDVNRATLNNVYVSGLDFSKSKLSEEQQAQVLGAAEYEVVLYGRLGALTNGYRAFEVTTAWRGMPGVKFAATDTFYRVENAGIQCIAAPCPSLRASKLHSTTKVLHHDLDVSRASMPGVDRNWLTSRVVDKDALVAARFVDGARVGGVMEKVLDASQVFIKIPDMTQSCGRPSIALCPAGKVNIWTRDENRCVMPAGCGGRGACAAFVPACTEGYALVSWTGGPFACTQYACDPEFLLQ